MKYRTLLRLFIITLFVGLLVALRTSGVETHSQEVAPPNPCGSFPMPNPSQIGTKKFEKMLQTFLENRCYKNWVADNQIRNSGPFIGGRSLGTHNAVKIFYSPEVWDWLKVRNRQGNIVDGAVIVKEMFRSPAKEGAKLTGWTAMVKDKNGSYDGWYWSYHSPGLAP